MGIGSLGLYGMNQSNSGYETVYADRTIPLLDLGTILDRIQHAYINAIHAARRQGC